MSDEEEESLYDKLIETNRARIVKYFDPFVVFDIMRQEGVMKMDDQERVMNMYPPTRRARAGQFLDILQTKGDNGVQKFINVLEYDYPHVYKLITNKDAKEPPKTFKQHRESIRSKWIDRLGEFVENIRCQHADNLALKEQLEDVKAVVNLNQENVQAAENDNNCLREKVRMLTDDNKGLREQNGNLLRERDRLKDDNLNIQRDCLEYFREKDYYKDKINFVQQEKETLEQENRKLKETKDQLKQCLFKNRDLDRTDKAEKIKNKLEQIGDEKDMEVRFNLEREILNDELTEAHIKSEELAEDLDNLRTELDRSQEETRKLKEKLERDKREKAQIEEWVQEKNKKIENYFERIGELEKDKQNLESERNREQQKNKELDEKYSKLFSEKHQQEQTIDSLKLEVQELKFRLRKSQELPPDQPPISEAPTLSNKSSESTDDWTEFIALELVRDLLPWKIEDYGGRPFSGQMMHRSGSLEEPRTKWTVKMKMPLLDKMSIVGGNFTGIFVDKVQTKKVDVPKPGDKIESIGRVAENNSRQDIICLEGLTHYQAKERLSCRYHTDDIEVTFRRRTIRDSPEYECVKKWMADTNRNSSRGDYFYVRANMAWNSDVPVAAPKHRIHVGDIFLVQDTLPVSAGEWQALKFDKKRGHWAPLSQSIPDSAYTRRQVIINRQASSEQFPGRKRAMKMRNLYTNVFPMKATSKLPVWMVGPQDVVMAIQELMCLHHPALFTSSDTTNLALVMSTTKTQNKHVLVHVNTQYWADKIGILLLINVQTKDQSKLSQILKKEVTPDVTTISETTLKQQGLDLEEVQIPSDEVQNEESLVNSIYTKINNMQKRILWLCDTRLKKYKPEILEEYKCFFTESNITIYSRLNSSLDESSNSAHEHSQDPSNRSIGRGDTVKKRSDDTLRVDMDRHVCDSWVGEPN